VSPIELVSALLASLGVGFYCAGTLGLLRFPDLFTRLHALTKADNVGLGLIVAAVAIDAGSWAERALLLLLWVVVMTAGASSAHAVARTALRSGVQPWRKNS
jgi:multicomponent Na+:H+ antiporter subunit G